MQTSTVISKGDRYGASAGAVGILLIAAKCAASAAIAAFAAWFCTGEGLEAMGVAHSPLMQVVCCLAAVSLAAAVAAAHSSRDSAFGTASTALPFGIAAIQLIVYARHFLLTPGCEDGFRFAFLVVFLALSFWAVLKMPRSRFPWLRSALLTFFAVGSPLLSLLLAIGVALVFALLFGIRILCWALPVAVMNQ